ncbi:MAG: hypothetical protein FWG29_03735 [Treponema sp.]|nr:hypothetical protein [Treponema sp.]
MITKILLIIKMLLFTVGPLVLFTCSLGMYDVLSRTTNDPFPEIPHVRSFNGDRSIVIGWTRDEAADEYYLYRARDTPYPDYELIYKGFLVEYRDNFTVADENYRFLYRLGKRRGNKVFADVPADTRGRAGLGVVYVSRRDVHEPNDDMYHATVLSTIKLEANSWLYGSNYLDNITLYDEDWYRVQIPANWTAGIKLIELGTTVDAKHFNIEILGGNPQPFTSNTVVPIVNNDNYSDWFYFRIYPNFSVFRLEPEYQDNNSDPLGPKGGFGAFIAYTIEVSYMIPNSN